MFDPNKNKPDLISGARMVSQTDSSIKKRLKGGISLDKLFLNFSSSAPQPVCRFLDLEFQTAAHHARLQQRRRTSWHTVVLRGFWSARLGGSVCKRCVERLPWHKECGTAHAGGEQGNGMRWQLVFRGFFKTFKISADPTAPTANRCLQRGPEEDCPS